MRKTSFIVSVAFIALCSILSLLAYVIIDDQSPFANNQKAEIALKDPGFSTNTILLKNNRFSSAPSFIQKMLHGAEAPYDEYPIKSITIEEKQIITTTYYEQEKVFQFDDLYTPSFNSIEEITSEKRYILGTDRFGRSISSRLLLGIRISLIVGFIAVLISVSIGILLGSIGGYFGGFVDRVIMYIINVMWALPTILLVFAIVIAFGRGMTVIFIAVGLTMWVDVARIVRGQVKKIKEEQFIVAAKSMGFDHSRIIVRHVLPNIVGPVLVIAAANFATAILIEAGLSYLGFGVKPPTPSIGNMLNEHYGYAITGKPFLAFVPAIAIMLLVLAFNLIGTGLRDWFDVKSE